ncbi:MAG: hypothetical protein II767_07905 [Proteobacteria bacterium]|nr:hypothetical protein [Pseudomonadota bacterium]
MRKSTFLCIAILPLLLASCNEKYEYTCGNGSLEGDEICDGDKFSQELHIVCLNGAVPDKTRLSCTSSCTLNTAEACRPVCGNGVIEGDEQCDGTAFPQIAAPCADADLSKMVCMGCHIVDLGICPGNSHLGPDDPGPVDPGPVDPGPVDPGPGPVDPGPDTPKPPVTGVLISEVVPHFLMTSETMSIDGLAVEITNMGADAMDMSACSLALINESGIQKRFGLSELGVGSLGRGQTTVVCSQAGDDRFEGACNATISENGILNNMAGMYYLGIVCSNDKIYDLFNLNSFIAAIQNYGVDFVRNCDAEPVTESQNALLGEGWAITADTTGAPTYGLGSHCTNIGSRVESCKYTISRNTLTDRSQKIDVSFEVKIPGITDKTSKTDANSETTIQFITGMLDGNQVKEQIIHLVAAKPDMTWTSEDGVDKYVGTLRNWDLYDGFIYSDVGTYVFDASVSFDHGQTRVFCGPKGIISNYSAYNSSERNTVVVSYDDEGGKCGDGIISSSEVCDGMNYIEDALECENPDEIVYDTSKVKCYCSMLSTLSACAKPSSACGNSEVDTGEVCDGGNIPDKAKKCPSNMIELSSPKWSCDSSCLKVDVSQACELACGNHKIDASHHEVCDSEVIPDELKVCPKDYVPVSNPTWACDANCAGIVTEQACELACGNHKIDNKEACDGDLVDHEAAAAACQNATYDRSRATCNNCKVDPAACVPNMQFVFDEYIVMKDDKGKPEGVAISINYYGDEPVDIGSCNLSILNEKGSFAVQGAYYFSFLDIAHATESSYMLAQCRPLVVCSEPIASESEYKDIFGEKCDAVLGGFDFENNIIDNLFLNYDAIDTLQISCGGNKIDYFDFSGFRSALAEGYTHGKLSGDMRPWSGRESVDLKSRMTLDKSSDLDAFAKPVCR